ncbi:GTP 3',8-cyclase MoaA [uncultured Desulfuromonas sp.]|uniref:GTP 3',8-cyclase MoaA n=1 Tax=uncultured Desulfuromonas sp. TaxID=181013 RepID=UPI002626A75D|nr:GTP 3',8-cyclase MoaA [uncultured Desulfuromonas sp.]
MQLFDSYHRKIGYLRLSVTDLCNLRCRYCMPADGVPKVSHGEILSYEDLYRVAQAAVSLGIEKIRVTGGEPLVRRGIVEFLARLSKIPGLSELAVTTNGVLLKEMAEDLRIAGVQRLNISLDSLHPVNFTRITRRGSLQRVLAGVTAAEKAGFPIKLNTVVMRGINDGEIEELAALTLEKPFTVRFIEYMPTLNEKKWQSLFVPGEEILERIARRFAFEKVAPARLAGPSRDFRITGATGKIGVITAVSQHFCGDCNRIRVTATGKVQGCLFSKEELDLKPILQAGDTALLGKSLGNLVGNKPESHPLLDAEKDRDAFVMASVGG